MRRGSIVTTAADHIVASYQVCDFGLAKLKQVCPLEAAVETPILLSALRGSGTATSFFACRIGIVASLTARGTSGSGMVPVDPDGDVGMHQYFGLPVSFSLVR